MAVEDACPYDTVCFHCQQAVEKYLKALLIRVGVDFPRTHQLGFLLRQLPPDRRLSVPVPDILTVNPYSVDIRYADDWREPTRSDAMQAIDVAQRVRTEIRNMLPPEALL
jgi:HEPN domain-containing protein